MDKHETEIRNFSFSTFCKEILEILSDSGDKYIKLSLISFVSARK